jgi:hypothetical protein
MGLDDGDGRGEQRPWQRPRASGNGAAGPGGNGPAGPGQGPVPSGAQMPQPVKNLRVLMTILGGMQAILGLALVTNSVAIATSIWGEADASTPCCTTPGEAHSGVIVFAGVLVLAVAAWGVVTALKFPTRHPNLRVSAFAYGWTALPFALASFKVAPVPGVICLVPAILVIVRPNQPESRAWFGHQSL